MTASKQSGVFSIELAFVLVGMSAALYFCFDLGFQQTKKSQLERVSYSLVSVLKERKLFFESKDLNTGKEASQLHNLAAHLLNVDKSKVAVTIERRVGKEGQRRNITETSGQFVCATKDSLDSRFDIPLEKSKKVAPVYQVTVCQQVPAWFERAIGKDKQKTERILTANSAFLGR
jgi:tight adherence protein F